MNTLKIFQYNDQPVSFRNENGVVYVNATEMAKQFGKKPNDYLRLPSTIELINELSLTAGFSRSLILTEEGRYGGSWFHEDLALDYAQWLSVKFRVWCNDRLKELGKHGATAVNPEDLLNPDFIISLATALKTERAEKEQLRIRTEEQTQQLQIQAPKVEYHDTVLQSDGLIATTVIAQELGMSAVSLNRELVRRKIIYGVNGTYTLFSSYKDKGYTAYKTHYHTDALGRTVSTQHLYWTQSGRKFLLGEVFKKIAC